MKKITLWVAFYIFIFPAILSAQEGGKPVSFKIDPRLESVEFGLRYDDNVFRSTAMDGRLSDGIYYLDAGGVLRLSYDSFRGNLGYHLGADQYLSYSSLNNLKNDFELSLLEDTGNFTFFYKKEYFFRNGQNSNFNYFDDDNFFGVQWVPPGPWNYEAKYKNFYRQYYDFNAAIRSRNFVDQAVLLSVQREIDERFLMKLGGNYTQRRFNRFAVAQSGASFVVSSLIQTDETWIVLFNAHFYLESILQDVNFEQQRTNSNSYGFSNTVQSVSWAGVVQPVSTLYLQLFFRLYLKNYDAPPLNSPDLQVGFVDEDGQDLLSLKSSWELSPEWTASLSVSRVRNESTQPGLFYIKNIFSAQMRRTF